jgi:hypothetical protein
MGISFELAGGWRRAGIQGACEDASQHDEGNSPREIPIASTSTPRRAPALLALACAPLLAHAGELAGTVRDAVGQPVAGALVVALSETRVETADGKPRRWIATSDAGGRFAFDGFPAGDCHVSANAGPDRVGFSTTPCRLGGDAPTAAVDVVVAAQPQHASGHVQRPHGTKAGADDVVVVARFPANEDLPVTLALGTRIVDDTWSLDLPAGRWAVRAVTAAGDSRLADFVVPGQATPVELRYAASSLRLPALARELHAMAAKDQDIRNVVIASDRTPKGWARVERVDRANLARLKQMIRQHGWPTGADIGDQGMQDLWVLAQHAPGDFIAQALPPLRAAADRGEIPWSTMALMIDRDLMDRHQPQVYGSQGRIRDGRFELYDVQDEAHLDERRAQVGLGPIAEYKALIEKDYQPASARR